MFLIKDFKGFTPYEKIFFGLFMAVQIAILVYFQIVDGQTDWLNVIASVSGILCVIMSAKGRLSTFFYGIIQVLSYGYICLHKQYYGEVGLQIVFGIFQFIGLYTWIRNMHIANEMKKTEEVDTKGLKINQWAITGVITVIVYIAGSYYLQKFGSKQPWVDGMSVALSLVGQTLMTLRFKEQWFFWIAVNFVSITLWVRGMILAGGIDATGVTMAFMWIGFLINSVYGYFYWKKLQHVSA